MFSNAVCTITLHKMARACAPMRPQSVDAKCHANTQLGKKAEKLPLLMPAM